MHVLISRNRVDNRQNIPARIYLQVMPGCSRLRSLHLDETLSIKRKREPLGLPYKDLSIQPARFP